MASFDLLSAYVDGELVPAEAARVAQLLAADPAIAAQVAALHEMRASVAGIAPDVVFVDIPHVALPRQRWLRPAAISAMAAAFVGMVVLAVSLFGADPATNGSGLPTRQAGLVATHDAWTETRIPLAASGSASHATETQLLAATGLTELFSRSVRFTDGHLARHTGYAGQHGCRISLFAMAPEIGPTEDGELVLGQQDDLLTANWRSQSESYVMIARNMDGSRFAAIASSMRQWVDRDEQISDDVLVLLGQMRQRCLV